MRTAARNRGLRRALIVGLLCVAGTGCAHLPRGPGEGRRVFAVDAGGRPISAVEVGSSVSVGARRLRPSTLYEFRLALDRETIPSLGQAIGFARVTTDAAGDIPPFTLWYQSGVVGCGALAESVRSPKQPVRFRTFDDAEQTLRGRRLVVTVHPVERDPTGRRRPMELRTGPEVGRLNLPLARRRSPLVYPSDRTGCLLNGATVGAADLYASGRGFRPLEWVELSVVPNRRAWSVGDAITDVTGVGAATAPERVQADSAGRFTVRVWDRSLQARGAFDLIADRIEVDRGPVRILGERDIASFGAETAVVLSLRYPVGGPTMDIAGRQLTRSPYFEFADAFAETGDPVWGAVDPTYVPVGHPGGSWAAYYVVNHRDVAGWDPTMGGSTVLVDVSGGVEIQPVKAGCINGTDVVIWNSPLTLGDYDVVVDFGATPATSPSTYTPDGQYNATVDFLDGADQVGFSVVRDPYELGPSAIGSASYSFDDFFPTLGGAADVDLRAVVRYPATVSGTDTPVLAGAHPIFVIEHGNHAACRSSCPNPSDYTACHASCPIADRVPNHLGYMRLLEVLASHGAIAVSIDAFDLTGNVPQWIPERGSLILKHLEFWSHLTNPATYPAYSDPFAGRFVGHVDMSRISISGHSRGGEASVAAYMLNTAFSIGSVSSIAPVDGQGYVLPNLPYFVILPAADGDVSGLSGARIYDRAGTALPVPDGTTKSGIIVYGANHNFFNTVWAADWDDSPGSRADYIPPAAQQRLGEAYLAAFARIHLLGEAVYEDMLRGRLVFPSTAGHKIYNFRHETAHAKLVAGTATGFTAGGGAALATVSNPAPHQTQAVRMGWSGAGSSATHTVAGGQGNASAFEVVALRAAQTWAASNPATGNQDFVLELAGGGSAKGVYVGQFDAIPKPYPHPYGLQHTVMTSVRVPLHSFIMNHAGVDLANISSVRLRFDGPTSGEILADDLEFSR